MGRDSSSRRHRKRKGGRDEDDEDRRSSKGRSRSRSPERKSRKSGKERKREREASSSPPPKSGEDKLRERKSATPPPSKSMNEESLSIEETNKLRASLGLAPLETDEGPKVQEREADDGSGREKIVVEDGMEFVHRAAEHIGDKKRAEEIKEKLQAARDKRRLHEKVLKVKGLAESDSEDEGAAEWVRRNRELELERKRAEERAKMLDELDADFGVGPLVQEEKSKLQRKVEMQRKKEQKERSELAGLIVAHSKEAFLDGRETVLVLEDKDVLDDGEEVLINPNLIENKRYERNVELRKRKDHYEPYKEELDEFGMPKPKGLLSKYDEELEGEEKEMFRLDDAGEVDAEKERREMEIRRKLFMANKKLVSLESPKYKVASEFYTEEEMISFRRPKSKKEKKMRKRTQKILKASDLLPEGDGDKEDAERAARLAARNYGKPRQEKFKAPNGESVDAKLTSIKLEDGELEEEQLRKDKWQQAETSAAVDIERLNKFVKKDEEEEESDDEDDLVGGVDLTGVVIEDDAEDELASMLDRARKLRQIEAKSSEETDAAAKVHEMVIKQEVKEEPMNEDKDSALPEKGVVIDSTMEYCRNLGEIPTYGLAGNRKDAIDVSELVVEGGRRGRGRTISDDEDDDYKRRSKGRNRETHRNTKGKWLEATTTSAANGELASSSKEHDDSSDSELDSDQEIYNNVLGEERDVTKGVGAMLKLAGEKGYLETGKVRKVNGPSLKHLESKRFSQIESGRYDIEEKYTKKLERMGTTGTGPVRPFPEKVDYKPDIQITYIDQLGREMESKDAFRVLSWKFHGKGPGKKQIEKRQAKQDKKELMKKMNSMDTPLGTLEKQLRKQEATQSPYIILSGSGRDTGATLTKD